MKMTKSEQLNDIELILSHLSHFATNEDIAKKLFVRDVTVKTHMNTIFKKLKVKFCVCVDCCCG